MITTMHSQLEWSPCFNNSDHGTVLSALENIDTICTKGNEYLFGITNHGSIVNQLLESKYKNHKALASCIVQSWLATAMNKSLYVK
jgi:hypothetical protein